ncbi:hypothetical protein [Pannonibacter indicus]|uniref:hypothetical protein n=1 Tax=Pannonibacter indicus TaxID=466044 RepID=UPI0039199423
MDQISGIDGKPHSQTFDRKLLQTSGATLHDRRPLGSRAHDSLWIAAGNRHFRLLAVPQARPP